MSFEQPQAPQERSPESIREGLRRKIEEMNGIVARNASLAIDEIETRPEVIDAQAALIADLFVAAEDEPELMLELAGEVEDAETRRDLSAKAVVAIGAQGDAAAYEGALEKHQGVLRSRGWDAGLVEAEVKVIQDDVFRKRVGNLVDAGQLLEAVQTYMAGKATIRHDAVLDTKVAAAAVAFVSGGADLSRKIERYAQMPDGFPELGNPTLHASLYKEANAELPPDMPWEERIAALERRFAGAPDIVACAAVDRYMGNWEKEDTTRIFKAVRAQGGRESVMSEFLEYHFTPEGFQELKPDLFEAYLKFKPDAILDRIDKFKEQFDALPEEEREALIAKWITEQPEMLAYRLGKTLRLDADQQGKLVDRIFEIAPGRLGDPEFVKKLPWDEARFVRHALETGGSAKMLGTSFAAGLTDEALSKLANDAVARSPASFVDRASLKLDEMLPRLTFDRTAVQEGYQKLLLAGDIFAMVRLENSTGIPFDAEHASEDALRAIRLTSTRGFVETFPALGKRLAMVGVLGKLEKIQGRAARDEHDAWSQELDPLLAQAYREGFVSPEKPEDAELLLEFVKEFGAVNTPKLFETYVGLKRAKTVEEIPEGVRKMLEEALGRKRVEKMKTPAFLLNEIRKFDRGMVSALLEDKIPAGLTSELGLELFDQKKGASNWGQDDDPKELIAKWERFKKASPERAAVPEGYVETRMSVPLMERGGKDPKLAAILERPELRQSLDAYAELFRYSHENSEENEALIQKYIDTHPEASELFLDAARYSPNQRTYSVGNLEDMMDALRDDEGADAIELFTRLSAVHARSVAPEGYAEALGEPGSGGPPTMLDIEGMRNLLVDYVAEHYLHPSQETHRTGHEPFSPELRTALEKAWGLADKGANPIIKAFNDIEALKKNGKASGKRKEVALVPAQGLLRVYGGDLADACYTSRHNELAEGKYPDLHAMIFVTGRGTASERFAGSVLFVETETPPEAGGKKVLMVRANNPRENLIQDVDADALVRQTLDEAIATAKRRGLDMVVVPLDDASTSSSNRPAVSSHYQEQYGDGERIPLVRKAETNFNGYPNYDPEGDHGVVVVWSREEEAEEPG